MALYFCSGQMQDQQLFRHYALNVPLYTHFTSPIRRYADIIVHRLLASSLSAYSHTHTIVAAFCETVMSVFSLVFVLVVSFVTCCDSRLAEPEFVSFNVQNVDPT